MQVLLTWLPGLPNFLFLKDSNISLKLKVPEIVYKEICVFFQINFFYLLYHQSSAFLNI